MKSLKSLQTNMKKDRFRMVTVLLEFDDGRKPTKTRMDATTVKIEQLFLKLKAARANEDLLEEFRGMVREQAYQEGWDVGFDVAREDHY